MEATHVAAALFTFGAIACVTNIITTGKILEPVRAWIFRKSEPTVEEGEIKLAAAPWRVLAIWQTCPWCVSVWVSFALAMPAWTWVATHPPTQWSAWLWFWYAMSALAAAYATGHLLTAPRGEHTITHANVTLNQNPTP